MTTAIADTHQRPQAAPVECLLCHGALEDSEVGRVACRACQVALGGQLRELPGLYARLGAELRPGSSAGLRVSGTKSVPLPVNEEALGLRAWGGMVTDLQAHEDDWRRALRLPLASFRGTVEQTLGAAVEFLAGHLWWAAEKYPDIDGLAEDVRRLRGAALSVLEPREQPRRLGCCPAVADGVECRAVVQLPRGHTTAICRWCGCLYPPETWLELAAAQSNGT
jgi:hypothetical protein